MQDRPRACQDADAADGLEAFYRRPCSAKPEPGHKIYPYLLRGMEIMPPNQVWAMDITYIPITRGFVIWPWCWAGDPPWSVVAAVDNHGGGSCVATLEYALTRHGKPEIFNTDQGSQFSSQARRSPECSPTTASPRHRRPGAWRDLRAFDSVSDADNSIGRYLDLQFVHNRALLAVHHIKPTSPLPLRTAA